jgi:hypothetical protein
LLYVSAILKDIDSPSTIRISTDDWNGSSPVELACWYLNLGMKSHRTIAERADVQNDIQLPVNSTNSPGWNRIDRDLYLLNRRTIAIRQWRGGNSQRGHATIFASDKRLSLSRRNQVCNDEV